MTDIQTTWRLPDVTREIGKQVTYKPQRQVKVNAMAFAHMVRLLADGTRTCQELADETGLHLVTVYQYTRELHKAGAVHISAWLPDSRLRHNIKVFKLGVGVDKLRMRMTDKERQRRHREKVRAQNV